LQNEEKFTSARQQLLQKISKVGAKSFADTALELFRFQASYNDLYRSYLELLRVRPSEVQQMKDIPCLPISLFKRYEIKTGDWQPTLTFSSSGTTGTQTSRHLLRDEEWYIHNARRGFKTFYGPCRDYCFLALLPAYLERSGSSLVFMAQDFIQQSKHDLSGFFLNEIDELRQRLELCQRKRIPTVLLGVSFALWDLAEAGGINFPELIVMETGGMKGRREEITREQLHQILCKGLGVAKIHSEYGMTELLSQAYSKGEGRFFPAPTMHIFLRETNDPFSKVPLEKTGVVNVIDLANIDSIAFIATDDLGRTHADGSFEILGRLDASDVRGCNLLVES
jgi:phenylacetate-coenzyme A ligase PaaK-like adenylate-forming protein